jgi:uncharacterized protein YqeY
VGPNQTSETAQSGAKSDKHTHARTIADLGADENTPVGKVIGAVMRSGESVDGALVNKVVREELGS